MLEGKTILIGKEPEHGRLLIAVKIGNGTKLARLGQIGSVPASVSRCKPAEDVGHCRIDIDNNSALTLTNLKAANVTYVNGREIKVKRITADSVVALGRDKYILDIKAVLAEAQKLAGTGNAVPGKIGPGAAVAPEVSIKPLEKVWDDYMREVKAIKQHQKNIGVLASAPMGVSMLGGIIAFAAPQVRDYAIAFTVIAFFVFAFGLYKRMTDKSMEKLESLEEWLQDNYVCPNPKCRHYVGKQPYKLLRQNKKCNYCACKYTED